MEGAGRQEEEVQRASLQPGFLTGKGRGRGEGEGWGPLFWLIIVRWERKRADSIELR